MEVFPFVQCGLVAPLVVDGSPDGKSSCSVRLNGFIGSGSGELGAGGCTVRD